MHSVAVVEITIPIGDLDDYAWIFQHPATEMNRHERLNKINLDWLSRDRLAEALTVAANLELSMKLDWHFWQEPYWQGFRLHCRADFVSARDAVAFRLAWEPETENVSPF